MNRDQIKTRYGILLHVHCKVVAALGNDDERATELLGMVGELLKGAEWTEGRPTAGEWWVSFHPARRHPENAVMKVWITAAGVSTISGRVLNEAHFPMAVWLKRDVPMDPFAAREG